MYSTTQPAFATSLPSNPPDGQEAAPVRPLQDEAPSSFPQALDFSTFFEGMEAGMGLDLQAYAQYVDMSAMGLQPTDATAPEYQVWLRHCPIGPF